MPFIPTPSVTFAFSKKQEAWTSRYSFVPTCYANCSDEMISFKDQDPNAWVHDKNNQRNTFYGSLDVSTVELSFNDNPSAVKVFNSLSLETNRDVWFADFSTNDEYNDENKQSTDTLYVDSSFDKEGFKTFDIPRSTSNSTANIVPISKVAPPEEVQQLISGALYDFIGSPSLSPILIEVPLASIPSVSVPSGNGVNLTASFSANLGGNAVNGFMKFSEFLAALVNAGFYEFSSIITQYTDPKIVSVKNGTISLSFTPPLSVALTGTTADKAVWLSAVEDFLLESDSLFSSSPASVNGDQMRGPYLNTKLQCYTNEPLELHSVNVDYQISSSAARLTQNS